MTCPEMDLGEFGERIRKGVGDRRVPLFGSVELTERCNLDCIHCYINKPAGSLEYRQRELTADQWYSILDEIAGEDCLYLLLTGGEPLLRPDFTDIYLHAKRRGFVVILFTNGTLITPEIADLLQDWYPYLVEITLYGATERTYERITGVPGSFGRCLRGIELLRQRHVPLRLKTMGMTINYQEISQMRSFASEMGLDFRLDCLLRPRSDGIKYPTELRLPPHQVVELELMDKRNLRDWQASLDRILREPPVASDTLYICGAGISSFHISADGRLSLCLTSRRPSYSLIGGSFREGWHSFLGRVRARKLTRPLACHTCDYLGFCGHCPGMAEEENGDVESIVSYRCQITHLRAEHLVRDQTAAARRLEPGSAVYTNF